MNYILHKLSPMQVLANIPKTASCLLLPPVDLLHLNKLILLFSWSCVVIVTNFVSASCLNVFSLSVDCHCYYHCWSLLLLLSLLPVDCALPLSCPQVAAAAFLTAGWLVLLLITFYDDDVAPMS